jgi:lipopolysaccharide biosynthesis regulator YciM
LSATASAFAPACCRATCCCSRSSTEAAIESWQRIEQQDPTYLALVAQRLLDAFRKLDRRDEGLRLLRGYLERYPSLDLLDVVFPARPRGRWPEAAYELVRDELKRNPTLLGFDKLLEARLLLCQRRRVVPTWSWRKGSCRPTRVAWRAIGAIIAASRRASSTGAVRPAAAGRPIRRSAAKNST